MRRIDERHLDLVEEGYGQARMWKAKKRPR